MQTQSISQKFQAILDKQGFDVRAIYLGGRRIAIAGMEPNIKSAVGLISQIYALVKETHLEDTGEMVAVFETPDETTGRKRYEVAVAHLRSGQNN